MEQRRFQYSLGTMFFSMTCFAVACAGAAIVVAAAFPPDSFSDEQIATAREAATLFGWPMLFIGSGVAIATPLNQLRWGFLIGALFALLALILQRESVISFRAILYFYSWLTWTISCFLFGVSFRIATALFAGISLLLLAIVAFASL